MPSVAGSYEDHAPDFREFSLAKKGIIYVPILTASIHAKNLRPRKPQLSLAKKQYQDGQADSECDDET
jgi:hypothetical protein